MRERLEPQAIGKKRCVSLCRQRAWNANTCQRTRRVLRMTAGKDQRALLAGWLRFRGRSDDARSLRCVRHRSHPREGGEKGRKEKDQQSHRAGHLSIGRQFVHRDTCRSVNGDIISRPSFSVYRKSHSIEGIPCRFRSFETPLAAHAVQRSDVSGFRPLPARPYRPCHGY